MSGAQALGLETPVELRVEYVDVTALKAWVHDPVDWLLLRDAVPTLTLAIVQVRKRGILSHMPKAPREYPGATNKLCIQMTHARRIGAPLPASRPSPSRLSQPKPTTSRLQQNSYAPSPQKHASTEASGTYIFE